jgi:hypothetical protein
MNLLAFLCMMAALVAIAALIAIPDDVWQALADRIRNPRPSVFETYMSGQRAESEETDHGTDA